MRLATAMSGGAWEPSKNPLLWLWCAVVGAGSAAAVVAAKRV